MATIEEAPTQLQAWIDELDGRIETLSLQRRAMAATLAALDCSTSLAPQQTLVEGLAERRRIDAEGARAKAADASARQGAKPKRPRAPSPDAPKYDYAEVARVANAALRGGLALGPAVASRFEVSREMGAWLVAEARRRGHVIPKAPKNPAQTQRNVSPIAKDPPASVATHPAAGPRAFTPDDTLKLLQGGTSSG